MDGRMRWFDPQGRELTEYAAKRIAELEAALRPFAEFDHQNFPDKMRAFDDDPNLVMGHFKEARRVLANQK